MITPSGEWPWRTFGCQQLRFSLTSAALRWILPFCLVPLCISGFQTAGQATTYLWWQTNFTAEHSQIIPDGDGYDVFVILKGQSGNHGQSCTATLKGPTMPFCPGSDVITEVNGSVTRQAR